MNHCRAEQLKEAEKDRVNPFRKRVRDLSGRIFQLEDREGELAQIFHLVREGRGAVCEIGSGSGLHLITLAKQSPQLTHFGFELRYKRAVRTIEKALDVGAENVFVLRLDAKLLGEIFSPRSLEAIYVNYPDPWEKRKTRKNRILGKAFLDSAVVALTPTGKVSVKTDHEEYFRSFLEVVKEHGGFAVNKVTFDLDQSEYRVESVETEFERLFRSQGLPLYFVELVPKLHAVERP